MIFLRGPKTGKPPINTDETRICSGVRGRIVGCQPTPANSVSSVQEVRESLLLLQAIICQREFGLLQSGRRRNDRSRVKPRRERRAPRSRANSERPEYWHRLQAPPPDDFVSIERARGACDAANSPVRVAPAARPISRSRSAVRKYLKLGGRALSRPSMFGTTRRSSLQVKATAYRLR